jgi:alpha-galactosidase
MNVLSEFQVADTTARFVRDGATGRVGLILFPTPMADQLAHRRRGLRGLPYIDAMPDAGDPRAIVVDPLAHVKIVGDSYPGAFAQGRTMRNAPTIDRFAYRDQCTVQNRDRTTVATTLADPSGCRIEHRLAWHAGDAAIGVETEFFNDSPRPVTLEMLGSFSLGGITPFDAADAPGRLRVHRFRSVWSAEGRLETRSIEDLHLERSWSGAGAFSERFGQVGSMPVRGWVPFVAIEDTVAGVVWGAQLAWAGSWQLEIFRQHDDVCLSGGLADREFGHWTKTLAPGESIATPPATLACVRGDLDDLCDRMTAVQHRAADVHPKVEHDLPIVFNEWCTTWGDPTHEKVVAIADRLKGTDTRYLVIDAGWYKGETGDWGNGHGDWNPSRKLFPHGLESTAAAIRDRGLIPGLWFEMETVGDASAAFSLTDHLLKRDGIPVTVRHRRFWDLSDAFVTDYLSGKVIDLLERCGFGYLKVDYNETIGIGSDHSDGQGEGLRRQIEGVYRFFDRIRMRLPDLVVENCSSGGHRLEPSMLGRTAMSSFSDAHELIEIPIVAANLHRLMLPRQSQIWAVLHPTDTDRRLTYSLAATFLGRMCISGDVVGLSASQWELVGRAQAMYRRAAGVIKHGTSRRFGAIGASWRHPQGWQGVLRVADDGRLALVVAHAFAGSPRDGEVPLPDATWRITGDFHDVGTRPASLVEGRLLCPLHEWSGRVVLLERTKGLFQKSR